LILYSIYQDLTVLKPQPWQGSRTKIAEVYVNRL